MSQSFTLEQPSATGGQRIVGPVSGLPAGSVLPGPVSFSMAGVSAVAISIDEFNVKVQSVAGQSGDSVLTVSSESLSDTVTFSVAAPVPPPATSLDIPVGSEQAVG